MIQYVFYLLLLEISLLILLLLNTPLRAPVVELIAKLKHGRYRLLMITAAMVACLAVGASSLCKLYKNGTLAFTLPSFFDFILSKTRLLIIGSFVLGTAVVMERVQEFMWEIRCLRISNNDRDGEIMILKTKIGKMEVIVSSKIADMKAAETYLYNTNYKITRPEDFLYKNTAYWSSHSDIY